MVRSANYIISMQKYLYTYVCTIYVSIYLFGLPAKGKFAYLAFYLSSLQSNLHVFVFYHSTVPPHKVFCTVL